MTLFIPIFLFLGAIAWILYTSIIKKNWKKAAEILRPTLFFGLVWGIIYYFLFDYKTNSPLSSSIMQSINKNTITKQKISIITGEKFLWKSGLCLKATEESTFLIPGAIFPQDTPIGKILQLSDENTMLHWLSDPRKYSNPLPDFKVTLKTGTTLKINRNTEVILTNDSGTNKANKDFMVEEGSLETNPNPK